MPHIYLTKTCTVATECIEKVQLLERNGKPVVEVHHKRQDWNSYYLWEEEALEAWANWKTFITNLEESCRNESENGE